MTKILVVSDSHGSEWKLDEAIKTVPDAKIVFHLGDGEHEARLAAEKYGTKFFHLVCGNCDWGSELPPSIIDVIEGKRIYACHGHTHLVKYGTADLVAAAKEQNCSVALYGHTHNPVTNYVDGILLFNPGSIKQGNFGTIDIAENGILPVLRKLD
ncbi:MAG: metallophosphoesterase [Clostridia bacterium]|nr:metallophosphoesterase [Clostridia bacterium]